LTEYINGDLLTKKKKLQLFSGRLATIGDPLLGFRDQHSTGQDNVEYPLENMTMAAWLEPVIR